MATSFSFSLNVFISRLSGGAETPAGALEEEQLGNYEHDVILMSV